METSTSRHAEDIYEEITDNPRVGKLRLVDTYELVKEVIEKL